MTDDFGDRMKNYERHETDRRFIPLLPVYARIDGRSFSTFTAGFSRPYDIDMSSAMIETTRYLVRKTNSRIGFCQSDEISLVWLQEEYQSELFFNGKIQKMVSVLAGMASAFFNQYGLANQRLKEATINCVPHFDCRVFQLPNKTEATNALLWREKDAAKNSVSMAARSFYSHRELEGKSSSEMQEMMFQKGQNWNDYPAFFKRGIFLRRVVVERPFTKEELGRIPIDFRPTGDIVAKRTMVIQLDMPSFGTVTNREAVIFDGAEPIVETR